ncbi:S-adenosyl-L-methionine-dependent methyltransferase [Cercophora newfieldiana]|uniref:S-adenosyl-L-methionine-dependent methyltransferase n=1 Tax=Cercophora newfieldiana TaxID=92897 RepID=A0AA40CZK5_9PEZI|nr:S-adenosyl-L-methionine-dependent methyltransferase [Cercophora newfieldiana]
MSHASPPASHPQTVRTDDYDSAVGSEDGSSTTSMDDARDAFDDAIESAAHLQNEDPDMKHHMLQTLNEGKLYHAPVVAPGEVLDVGTGKGIWAREFADCFPSAVVTGVDKLPIQGSWATANCRFEVDDVCKEWTYRKGRFGFIHIRCLLGYIDDWNTLAQQAYRCMEPGGWIEHAEISAEIASQGAPIPPDHIFARWNHSVRQAGATLSSAAWMEQAGFVVVKTKTLRLPIGPWPREQRLKEVGAYHKKTWQDGIHRLASQLRLNVLSMGEKEVKAFMREMVKAFDDRTLLPYCEYSHTWAQKPLEGGAGDKGKGRACDDS